MPCPIPHQPKPPTRSPLYYRFPELTVYHGLWIHSIYEPAKDMMGELPNASLPQSYHGDRITPEQASPLSSPSAHPTPTPASFKHLFGGCACPIVVPLNRTVPFFSGWEQTRQHHTSTSQTTPAVGVSGRIAVQAEPTNPSNGQ
jgi:hypothetical protein